MYLLLKRNSFYKIAILLLLVCFAPNVFAQVIRPGGGRRPTVAPNSNPTNNTPGNNNNNGRRGGDTTATLSNVERRDYSDDSLQVQVYTFNAVKPTTFDTSIRDYTTRFPIPATHIFLGNDGSATRSLLFSTPRRTGFDPGFHSHDVYKLKLENIRFYNTPKPYTELGFMIAAQQEMMVDILHTQNIKPYWNASFQYRLLSAPGIFRNQKNNHNSIQLTSWYQSPNKRYNNYFVVLNNKIQASENGGIKSNQDYLEDPLYQRSRFTIPTNLGGDPTFGADPFSSNVVTGRKEKEFNLLLRQQYDLGRKDSLVTDSTVIPLFYPRQRFEHTLKYGSYDYTYLDVPSSGRVNNKPDSAYYDSLYSIHLPPGFDSVFLQDRWKEFSNDFSIYQFPDANNLQQYIKLGAELQLISGQLKASNPSLYNIVAHGEYRNRTKNQKWDINASGRLHTAGYNSGDYHAFISLQRLLSKDLGTLQVGFENINRSPSFKYDQRSSFYLDAPKSFGKENTLHFFAGYFIPKLGLQLNGDYYFFTNYLYLNSYKNFAQESAVFNLLRVSGAKTFRLNRSWNLHSEVYVQQKAGGAQVNVPLLFTRNRLAYEGRVFRNLNISAGLEMRYHTPYKADNYSPVLGQFFYQDTITISNRPDLHAYLHMRIRTFKAFVRVENLNSASTNGGFGFNKNSLAAPYYPMPGMLFRLGIYWTFVN
ncbi:MAG: hypothetical protein EOO10_14900 [Chitinophagaceae bacterium]|nr:MAG: hypothetical protein EOO10_14900 [Chitinophagaceae bacterium]